MVQKETKEYVFGVAISKSAELNLDEMFCYISMDTSACILSKLFIKAKTFTFLEVSWPFCSLLLQLYKSVLFLKWKLIVLYQLNIFLDLISSWCILEFKISSTVLCICLYFTLLVLGSTSAGDYLLVFMVSSGFLTWWKRILRRILLLHARILSTWLYIFHEVNIRICFFKSDTCQLQ